jgi:transcriptional regulator with XRE-family HTH domain
MEVTDMVAFGDLMKGFRKKKKVSQQELSAKLGIHYNTLSNWERGMCLPDSKGMVLEAAKGLRLDEQETRLLLEASLTALAPYWHVPVARNPFFTGREDVLEDLHTRLGINQVVALTQSYALHGLGGIGKTQIALEYAYRFALEYSAVLWIEAETIESVLSSLLHIAEVLHLPGREEAGQQRIVTAVQRWLSTHNQWLLIWDNLEDLDLLQRFLPPARQGAILLTTRRQSLGTLARGIGLRSMEEEEGLVFVLRRAGILAPEASEEEVEQLRARMPGEYATAAELVRLMHGWERISMK